MGKKSKASAASHTQSSDEEKPIQEQQVVATSAPVQASSPAASAPLTPVQAGQSYWAMVVREFTHPRLLQKNMNLVFHTTVFGVAVFVMHRYGWFLKTTAQ